jgi:phosphate/sulfate permease
MLVYNMIWAILTASIWAVVKLEGGGQVSADWILQPFRAMVFPFVLWAVYQHEVGEEAYGREKRAKERERNRSRAEAGYGGKKFF